MTKAKARQRAKAKAGQKAKKRQDSTANPAPHLRPGQFDRGSNTITKPSGRANTKNFAETRRGAARSR